MHFLVSGKHDSYAVVDLEGAEPATVPFGRRTDAVTVLLISENGTVLSRRHRQF